MAYNGGCLIGVKAAEDGRVFNVNFCSRSATISGVTPTTLNSETTTVSASWQPNDGSWVPYQNCERTQSSNPQRAAVYATAPSLSVIPSWGLLFGYETKLTAQAYNLHSYFTAASSSSGFVAANNAQGLSVRPLKLQSSTRRLVVDFPTGVAYVAEEMARSYNGSYCGACWQEAYVSFLQELPYNQELVTYRRTRTAPTSMDIKTLDGAIRRAVTGVASTSISGTWRWSDDGTIAKSVGEILRIAMETLMPLVVYVPAGIYYEGPFLDLVIPSSEPTITMPAPGVYELIIEGTCQP